MSDDNRAPAPWRTCPWCKRRVAFDEMRYPGSIRGAVPVTCRACRDAHPDESWCSFHGEAHPAERFRPQWSGRPGFRKSCVAAEREQDAAKFGRDELTCAACLCKRGLWMFRGSRVKAATCRDCELANPGLRWCRECVGWRSVDEFPQHAPGTRIAEGLCRLCRTARGHRTTVAAVLAKQGAARPVCASCGSEEALKIDHDHQCCSGQRSCGRCVRGYLCHECNVAEGLLRSPARARALAAYMERHGPAVTQLDLGECAS